jgi:hypothetical protein
VLIVLELLLKILLEGEAVTLEGAGKAIRLNAHIFGLKVVII